MAAESDSFEHDRKRFSKSTSLNENAENEALAIGAVKILEKYSGSSTVMCCSVFPSNNQVAIGWADGTVEIRDGESFEVQNTLAGPSNLPVTSLSENETDDSGMHLLASYASGDTILWDAVESNKTWYEKEDRQTLVNSFNLDCSSFALSGSDAKISIYDRYTGTLSSVLQGSIDPDVMDGHTMRVFALRYHPTNKNELLSGGWDDTVQFWDVRDPIAIRKIYGPHICGNGIEFLGDNKVVTASWRKQDPLQVWDYGSGKLIQNINPDELTSFLYFCRYVESEAYFLVGGSHKNILRIIDVNTRTTLGSVRNLKGAVYFARELPKSSPLLYVANICFGSDNDVYVIQVET
ncbi:ribosome biogenesis protein WDR12 homolog [Stegodyphus dumicola]|uniref:ribosome biogenesis protein WDR12 homolog n=1 Tax=Stegodyphus dumicola TaxID=202533 RepID=UPI0015AD14E0|nr:ribosome biogenesis protein WDR12 homolog [Stegodyphus dumicola]